MAGDPGADDGAHRAGRDLTGPPRRAGLGQELADLAALDRGLRVALPHPGPMAQQRRSRRGAIDRADTTDVRGVGQAREHGFLPIHLPPQRDQLVASATSERSTGSSSTSSSTDARKRSIGRVDGYETPTDTLTSQELEPGSQPRVRAATSGRATGEASGRSRYPIRTYVRLSSPRGARSPRPPGTAAEECLRVRWMHREREGRCRAPMRSETSARDVGRALCGLGEVGLGHHGAAGPGRRRDDRASRHRFRSAASRHCRGHG